MNTLTAQQTIARRFDSGGKHFEKNLYKLNFKMIDMSKYFRPINYQILIFDISTNKIN
jgi:hypothetical protein